MAEVILGAADLDGYLSDSDRRHLDTMDAHYREAIKVFSTLSSSEGAAGREEASNQLIESYNAMGDLMQDILAEEPAVRVYSFLTPRTTHGEASRLIAKLRDVNTQHHEFVYYIQRAYELLFNLAFGGSNSAKKNYLSVKTPVADPVQNFAIHKIPDVDDEIRNSVMCVMLRGALLPSMIMSKEIQEYSSSGYVTPFALFRIHRDDERSEKDMRYILDLDKSFIDMDVLQGKDLFFADPMNATGGSLVTIVKYLLEQGVRPRSVKFFNVISALKGALRIVRAIENATVYTLWMDPALNERAYIMPGLGDAGDRLNGRDESDLPRNIIQLIANYGSNIAALYRAQVRKIEETVLGR
ncbi:MAG TPA: uracil phosphoribosyltransferase [Spirochaetia bacterium]|nr:uracil phosphoribosyltransferase [Spirochaetia bacterium]